MPLIPGFINTVDEMKAIHKSKSEDYAQDSNPFSNFDLASLFAGWFPNPRDIVYAVMIGIKIARLSVLMNKSSKPNNESIEDSFNDLANYVVIWKCKYMDSTKVERLSASSIEKANTV